MAQLKIALLKRLVSIVPIEDTYFIRKEVPDIKLSKSIVELNYGSFSPFKDGDIIFYKDKKYLYLWFTKNKILQKKLHIPECFFIYKRFSNEKDVIVIKDVGKSKCIVVLKDGKIKTQFCKKNEIGKEYIDAVKKEYALKDVLIKKISLEDSSSYKLTFQDAMLFFSSLDINAKSLFNTLYEEIKTPIIVLLVLLNAYDIALYKYTSGIISEKRIELTRLVSANKQIKEQFNILEKKGRFFESFIDKELKYPSLYFVISVITESVAKGNGTISIYRQSGNTIDLWVISPSTSSIVNNLITTKSFKNVQVINISKYSKDKTKEVGEIELTLRALNNE